MKFAAAGFIFSYNYDVALTKHDRQCLRRSKPLLSEMLKLNSTGMWLPNKFQDAISKLKEKTALNCHHTESVRAQAANLYKYFIDLRKIKSDVCIVCVLLLSVGMYPINYASNIATGSRSPDLLRDLCDIIVMNAPERKLEQDSELVRKW